MSIDGVDTPVGAGTAVFIPGDAEHGIRCEAGSGIKLLYVFPANSFAEVTYRFSGKAAAPS